MAQTFATYKPPEIACNGKGTWAVVGSDGRLVRNTFAEERGGAPLVICTCKSCGPTGSRYDSTELKWRATGSNLTGGQSVPTASHKLMYLGGPAEKTITKSDYRNPGLKVVTRDITSQPECGAMTTTQDAKIVRV
jgi:hypothetical protein